MALFLKIIEWTDNSNNTLVYKYPFKDKGREVNQKSKLIVRPSQQAIFVHKGKICEVFNEGTYSLNTEIFPILSKLAGWKYGFQSPIELEIYFINTKQFTANKWGTANPIMMRDPEFGMIRVRGFGSYSFKVDNSQVFLQELFGTNSTFKTADITDWLKTILISSITDGIAESKISVLDLAANTEEFNDAIKVKAQNKFNEIGLQLSNLFIENMSVPEEVEKAIDERTKLGILGDKTDTMMKIAAAEAMKSAAKNPGTAGTFTGAGIGIGAGVGLGAAFAEAFKSSSDKQQKTSENIIKCPSCGKDIKAGSKFCPECGTKIPTKRFCSNCGKELGADAKFCPECGNKL